MAAAAAPNIPTFPVTCLQTSLTVCSFLARFCASTKLSRGECERSSLSQPIIIPLDHKQGARCQDAITLVWPRGFRLS